jgi:hypothetical protein
MISASSRASPFQKEVPPAFARWKSSGWENETTMPRTCTICIHPDRLRIEQAIIAGTSLRTISGQYGPSKTAVMRHRSHVVEAMSRNKDVREQVRTGKLLDDVRAGEERAERLFDQATEILKTARDENDPRTALQAIRAASAVIGEARGYMQLRGELTNELGRDRALSPVSIQILCPSAPSLDAMPRVTFASDDHVEGSFEEIGLIQRIG